MPGRFPPAVRSMLILGVLVALLGPASAGLAHRAHPALRPARACLRAQRGPRGAGSAPLRERASLTTAARAPRA